MKRIKAVAKAWSKAGTMAALMCLTACSSETNENVINDGIPYQGEPIPIEVSVGGMEEFGASPVTRSGQMKESYAEPWDDDHNVITTIESIADSSAPTTRGALGKDIRFRVVAYRDNVVSAANFAGMADYYISGTSGKAVLIDPSAPLKLKLGTYKFVCYSYNTTTDINDSFDCSTTALSISQGQDFSMCNHNAVRVMPNSSSGIFSLPTINFQRLCSKITISVVSIMGNVTKCTGSVTNMNPGPCSWTLGKADLSTTTGTNGNVNFEWKSLNGETVNSSPQIVLPTNARTVTVTLSMTVGNKVTGNKTFTIVTGGFNKGTSYKITANVGPKSSISIPGLTFKVATGNVIKVGNTYKFQATQGDYSFVWNGGDYFSWGTVDPLEYKGVNSSFVDVCKQIGEKWRTPSLAEQMQYVNCESSGKGQYDGATRGNVTGWYFGVQPNGGIPLNKDNYVFLPMAGHRGNLSDKAMDSEAFNGMYSGNSKSCTLYFHTYGTIEADFGRSTKLGISVRCITGK